MGMVKMGAEVNVEMTRQMPSENIPIGFFDFPHSDHLMTSAHQSYLPSLMNVLKWTGSRELSNLPWEQNHSTINAYLAFLCHSHLHPPMAQPNATPAVAMFITAADIIATVSALVPNPAASVAELVKARLPEVISEHDLKKIAVEPHLVNLEVSGTLSDMLEGPIPHRTWLAKLQTELEKVQEGGCIVSSIQHPTQPHLIFPLWALKVWDSIAVAAQERMLWATATEWLKPGNHRKVDLNLVEDARALMAKMPWGMRAWALYGSDAGSRIGFLARFLSTLWLSERSIDIMGVCCNAATSANGGGAVSHMAPVYLSAQLQWISGWGPQKIRDNRILGHWRITAQENGYHFIHIPVNIIGMHWVVFLISIKDQTYSLGMSPVLVYIDVPC